jgi:transcriptional regulator with XRE-family HTH domain
LGVTDGSPTVRRRRLGLILRGLREKAGKTGEEVGAAIERSASWISRVETGRVGMRGRDLKDLMHIYRVDDPTVVDELLGLAREGKQRGWWSRYADTLSGPYATYIGFESEASDLRTYHSLIVPGLLQTEEYARAIFRSVPVPKNSGDAVERRTKIRLSRQDLLTKPEPLKLWAVMDEAVLRRRIGGELVLRDQLKRLLDISDLPNITVQVIPFVGGAHVGMIGSFSIVKFPMGSDPDVVYVEGINGGDVFAEGSDVGWYEDIFDHLRAVALSPADSCAMIREAAELS